MKFNYLFFGVLTIIVFSIPSFYISAQEGIVPSWLKNTAVWWGEGKINDQEFIKVLQWLIDEEIIIVPDSQDEKITEPSLNFDKIAFEVTGIEELIRNVPMRKFLADSNDDFSKTQDVYLLIEKRDQEWKASAPNQITPFIAELIENELSEQLRQHAELYQNSVNYLVYPEIFVTNSFGVNVAQTGKTSDYKQSDEIWWIRAKDQGLYISESHYDQSAGVTSADIAIRISGNQGEFLGVVKAVTNVQGNFRE